MRRTVGLPLAALAFLAACSGDAPTSMSDPSPLFKELVITEGAAAPATAPGGKRPSLSTATAAVTSTLGGSSTTPLSLTPNTCPATATQPVTVTYSVNGIQTNPGSFQVNTRWEYNGTTWSGSVPTTVNVPARGAGPPTAFPVTLTVVNASGAASGTSSFSVVPFNLSTSGGTLLNVGAQSNATVFVAFVSCAVTNHDPTLTLPNDLTVEAASSAGAVVPFASMVTASDFEDGDLSSSVVCTPASGSTFPLGETTVNCSVTDSDGGSASGSFKITVVDTTPPDFSGVANGDVFTTYATSSSGRALDLADLGISASDLVDGAVTPVCTPTDGSDLAIGAGPVFGTSVTCTATDAHHNSATVTFRVDVTLNVNAAGFLTPLRMAPGPYSAHKRGSTVPHKFLPPTYADGTPAIDLAAGLRLALLQLNTGTSNEFEVTDENSAGSTIWRYDPDAGQYIFNLKTGTASPWNEGTWRTTVSYAGITLATTQLILKR
jgi:hypothetical protein